MSQESDAFYESREWLDLRYKVLKKHNGCCQLCGHRGSSSNPIQVDHIQPRSLRPELQLAESNMQVLCKHCNLGKSNKDSTDWRWAISREVRILETCDPAKKAKLQQLGWLKLNGNGAHQRRYADKEYKALWREIETEWISQGQPE